MAHTRQLDAYGMDSVRSQLSHFLPFLGISPGSTDKAELADGFELFSLPLDALSTRSRNGFSLASVLQSTPVWHHQIKINGSFVACARSTSVGPQPRDRLVNHVFQSALAASIDSCIDLIDTGFTDPTDLADLFVIPAYHLHGFLMRRASELTGHIVIVNSPFRSRGLPNRLAIPESQFIDMLLRVSPIMGIILPR